jgi:hypothetical protein
MHEIGQMDSLELYDSGGRHPFLVEDIHLICSNASAYVVYNIHPHGKFKEIYVAELLYEPSLQSLHVNFPPHKLDVSAEAGQRHQKNWSPFVWDVPASRRSMFTDQQALLYIYSILPHRIVFGYWNESVESGILPARSICVTHAPEFERVWKFGEPRGGSQAIRIDTAAYGPKYITFFHSSAQNIMYGGILTYFMGAYLFDVDFPFAITHVSSEPIYPYPFYDDNFGWSYHAVDFVIFPMAVELFNGELVLSVGKNDNSGYVLTFDINGLVESLLTVNSTTLQK